MTNYVTEEQLDLIKGTRKALNNYTSLKVIFLFCFSGTELHVLMDLIAINGWIYI